MIARPSPPIATALASLVAVALLLVSVGPLLLLSDLPDPLAVSWDLRGQVTSTRSVTGQLQFTLLFVVPGALAAVLLIARSPMSAKTSRPIWAGTAAGSAAVFASWSAVIVSANHGHAEASTSDRASLLLAVLFLVANVVVIGGLIAWIAPRSVDRPALTPSDALDVPEGAAVSWTGTLVQRSRAVSAAVVAVCGGVWMFQDVVLGAIFLVGVPPALFLSRLAVYADRRGFTVTYGLWSWPRTQIPLESIARAAPADLRKRGAHTNRHGRLAFLSLPPVTRDGPGLVVELVDGGRFAVSIDDPETAAAVLNREVQRVARASGHRPGIARPS